MPIAVSEEILKQFGAMEPAGPPGAFAGLAEQGIQAQWFAEDGVTPVSDAVSIGTIDYVPREGFGPGGTIQHVVQPVALLIDAERPPEGRILELSGAGRTMAIPANALTAVEALAAPHQERFGAAGASFAFPVFAERFTDADAFFAAVKSLEQWIRAIAPFNEIEAGAHFAIDAYFWPSDPVVGQFGTHDFAYDCLHPPANAVTFLGNNALAKQRLGRFMLNARGGSYGLVLINSRVRGGAGGMAAQGFPAWASITACPTEVWQAVALHEIGHALGLADEYVDQGRADEPFGDEPNCSQSSEPHDAPWRDAFSDRPPGAQSIYSAARQARVLAKQEPRPEPQFVGLFQGARYSNAYYRPAFECLMKDTGIDHFCDVCTSHIRKRLKP